MAKDDNLPVISIKVEGVSVRALVDTGCSTSLFRSGLIGECEGEGRIIAFDGRDVKSSGSCRVRVEVVGHALTVVGVAVEKLIGGVDVVLGMDVIGQLGGVTVCSGNVKFGLNICATVMEHQSETLHVHEIKDKDFVANFDGTNWTVEWVWKESKPPQLKNKVELYNTGLDESTKEAFEKEICRWINDGILVPWEEEVEEGILPLMAVKQPTKGKVRPVLDYRELNEYVECHTGDEVTDICAEKLREWRRTQGETAIVDLKSAYLQIKVAKKLWKYQLVRFRGNTYCLTRLGFGLNAAPRIMSKILKTVLARSPAVDEATSSYIDDILVDTSKVPATGLVDHLSKFGLESKPPETLAGGAALGLRISENKHKQLMFTRGNEIPELQDEITRRELFSICGKLVGHYPVGGWLRVACSYIKRMAEGTSWADNIGIRARAMIGEVIERVNEEDPVKGEWAVSNSSIGTVWCDASSIALGVVLEIGDVVVEDAAWLRKRDDYNHINIAELEAVVKGVNLAIRWGLTEIKIVTDSATVYGWVTLTLSEERRVKSKGAAEILVKRRLGVLKNLVDELDILISIELVPSEKNKADKLTRVKKAWIDMERYESGEKLCALALDVKESHDMHHMGVERTLFLARKVDPAVTKEAVKRIVKECIECQSIDPAPVNHQQGILGVDRNWKRVAIDVTHFKNVPYLTIVDCGPGRLAIWKKLVRESADIISSVLEEIFLERGPVEEILMDNATAFRSAIFTDFLAKWNINSFYRAAYRASGNGIVERNHRTIKAIAERGRLNPVEAVFWYNMSPRSGQSEGSVPQRSIFTYDWRHPSVEPASSNKTEAASVRVGDEVWVKPPSARCTERWKRGTVTNINSGNNVSVDGMPRHILDVRPVNAEANISGDEATGEAVLQQDNGYPRRARQTPCWMDDYVL